jgi:hypothetical protein
LASKIFLFYTVIKKKYKKKSFWAEKICPAGNKGGVV